MVLLSKYDLGDQIKETQMGAACGIYGLHNRCTQGLVRKLEGK